MYQGGGSIGRGGTAPGPDALTGRGGAHTSTQVVYKGTDMEFVTKPIRI